MSLVVSGSCASSPSVRTFGVLKDEAAAIIQAPNNPEVLAAAGRGINAGIRFANARAWRSRLTFEDITFVADDLDYTIAADYKDSFHGELLDTNDNSSCPLDWQDPKTFLRRRPLVGTTGDPGAFSVVTRHKDCLLLLDHKPNAGFIATYPKLRHYYFPRILTLVDDSDVLSGSPSELENFLVAYGEMHVIRRLDPDRFADVQAHVSALWTLLVRDDNEYGFRNWSDFDV